MRDTHSLVGLTVLGLAFAAGGPLTAIACASWVRRRGERGVRPTLAGLRADAAIVLGARLLPDGRPTAMLEDRLRLGMRALDEGVVDRVLVSGLPRETAVMVRWLADRGVARDLVLADALSPRTIDSVRRARALGIDSAILCTQGFHLPRAVVLARHFGMTAVGVPADRGRPYRRQFRNEAREVVARVRAVIDMVGFRPPESGRP